jgi:hypothetical protein
MAQGPKDAILQMMMMMMIGKKAVNKFAVILWFK